MRARLLVLIVAACGLTAACVPLIEPAGPHIAAPHREGDRVIASDGAKLPLRSWLPEGRPSAVVLAVHGMNDYSNAFESAGTMFAARGIATYAYDQRGFGDAPNPGIWPGTDSLVSDLRDVRAVVGAAHPGAPLYLLGESMGGAVVTVAITGPDPVACDGVILLAPAVWTRARMGWLQKGALWLGAHVMPWYRVTGEGLNITPSDNNEMLRALSRDPLVIKRTRIDTIWGVVNLMDRAYADAAALDRPVLVLYGGRDEIIPKGPTFDFMRALPKGPGTRIAIYENGYHMLFRDLDGAKVIADAAAWIADRAAPLPSGADQAAARVFAP